MDKLSKETIGVKRMFSDIQTEIRDDYNAGRLTEYRLTEISCAIDYVFYEALLTGNQLNLLELRDAIQFGNRLRLLLAEKLYKELISDDWKAKLEECLNSKLIC